MGAIEDHISRLAERLRKAETISAAFLAVQAQTQNPTNTTNNAPSSAGSDENERKDYQKRDSTQSDVDNSITPQPLPQPLPLDPNNPLTDLAGAAASALSSASNNTSHMSQLDVKSQLHHLPLPNPLMFLANPIDPHETPIDPSEELRLLKAQVQDVARVCKAVANGDLSQKIVVPVQGHVMVELKDIINSMVDRLRTFATEVTRVSLEVGSQGKLGGQAVVEGVDGTWRELTDTVNSLAANLTNQVRSIAEVTKAVAKGDLTKTIEVEANGEILELKMTINGMVVQLNHLAAEVTRVSLEVGSQGKLGGQAEDKDLEGVWKDLTINVNRMCTNLTNQVRSIGSVTTAVARGDLSQTINILAEGEMALLKDTVNGMVGQLRIFAREISRVSLEVGTQGKLGGQAVVEGVEGTWAELTHNVNKMAANLTSQVREIAQVTKSVAKGDLTKTVDVDVQGEILELKLTVNNMVSRITFILY